MHYPKQEGFLEVVDWLPAVNKGLRFTPTSMPSNKKFRDNFDNIFGGKNVQRQRPGVKDRKDPKKERKEG